MKIDNQIHNCASVKLVQLCIILVLISMRFTTYGQSSIISTICGQDSAGYCCDGELAVNAALNTPFSIQIDNHNNLYIDDGLNQRLRKIDLSTGIIKTIAGTGAVGFFGDGGLAIDAEFYVPEGFCIDSAGNIYIADAGNNRIRKINAGTGVITTIAGNGIGSYWGDGNAATDAELYQPSDVCVDKLGNIYIADFANAVVRKIDISGVITTVAGNGTIGFAGDGGLAINANLDEPLFVITDQSNNLLISDYYNNRVRKVDVSTGIITTIAGNGIGGNSGNGDLASAASIGKPSGLTLDENGNIYVCQFYSGVIRRIDINTGIITTVAGNGTEGFLGDGGLAIDAELAPAQMCFSSNGNIYVADENNNRIRKISASVGIHNVAQTTDNVIYPNPSTGKFTVKTSNTAISDVTICNAVGSTVATLKVDNNHLEIDISNQPDGVYFVSLKTPKDNHTYKVIIAK